MPGSDADLVIVSFYFLLQASQAFNIVKISGTHRRRLSHSISLMPNSTTMSIVRDTPNAILHLVDCFPTDTPYEGFKMTNWPRYTILRGKVMWANGKIVGKVRDGRYVKRGPSQLSQGLPGADRDPRRVAAWLYE